MLVQILSRKSVRQPCALFFLMIFSIWLCQKSDYLESNPNAKKLIAGSNSSTQQSAPKINYSAEELFRGIMFGDGRVADVIPEIKNFKEFVGINAFNTQEQEAIKILTIGELNSC